MKTVKVELNAEELSHIINDVIAYMWEIKKRASSEAVLTERGYYSRNELKEKLLKIEREAFPQLDNCCG